MLLKGGEPLHRYEACSAGSCLRDNTLEWVGQETMCFKKVMKSFLCRKKKNGKSDSEGSNEAKDSEDDVRLPASGC